MTDLERHARFEVHASSLEHIGQQHALAVIGAQTSHAAVGSGGVVVLNGQVLELVERQSLGALDGLAVFGENADHHKVGVEAAESNVTGNRLEAHGLDDDILGALLLRGVEERDRQGQGSALGASGELIVIELASIVFGVGELVLPLIESLALELGSIDGHRRNVIDPVSKHGLDGSVLMRGLILGDGIVRRSQREGCRAAVVAPHRGGNLRGLGRERHLELFYGLGLGHIDALDVLAELESICTEERVRVIGSGDNLALLGLLGGDGKGAVAVVGHRVTGGIKVIGCVTRDGSSGILGREAVPHMVVSRGALRIIGSVGEDGAPLGALAVVGEPNDMVHRADVGAVGHLIGGAGGDVLTAFGGAHYLEGKAGVDRSLDLVEFNGLAIDGNAVEDTVIRRGGDIEGTGHKGKAQLDIKDQIIAIGLGGQRGIVTTVDGETEAIDKGRLIGDRHRAVKSKRYLDVLTSVAGIARRGFAVLRLTIGLGGMTDLGDGLGIGMPLGIELSILIDRTVAALIALGRRARSCLRGRGVLAHRLCIGNLARKKRRGRHRNGQRSDRSDSTEAAQASLPGPFYRPASILFAALFHTSNPSSVESPLWR